MHATSPAPNRSIGSTTVSFGLINIPVSIYKTTVDTATVRHEYTADGHSVGRKMVDKETGAEVAYADVVKAVEHDGILVPLSNDEIAEATGHESGVAPIVGKVSLASLATDFIAETVYQLRPKSDKKVKTASEKAFKLLTETLAATGEAALVRVSIRGSVARWGAITPDGLLKILHSADQVRQALPMPEVEVSEAELTLAKQLLDVIPAVDPATTTDDSSQRVADYVASKAAAMVAGGEVAAPVKADHTASYDLMEAMMASMASMKASAA